MSPEAMNHPDPAMLTALGAGLLEAGEAAELERHISACGDCRRKVTDARADFERFTTALDAPVPAALESRVRAVFARRPRRIPWLSAAAAVLILALGGTVTALYRRVAALEALVTRPAAPATAPSPAPSGDALALAELLKDACASQIDQRALEVADAATLNEADTQNFRGALARASEESTRQIGRYLSGDLSAEELVGRDLLAALDKQLGKTLALVAPTLERHQAHSVAHLVQDLTEDLCRQVGASEAQCDRIRRALMRVAGERRDLAFLPGPVLDVIKRIELTDDRGWKGVIAGELSAEQKTRFEEYSRAQKKDDEEVRSWYRSQVRRNS